MAEVLRVLGAISFSAGVIVFLFGYSANPVFSVGLAMCAIANGVLLIGFGIIIEQGREIAQELSRLVELQQLGAGAGSHSDPEGGYLSPGPETTTATNVR